MKLNGVSKWKFCFLEKLTDLNQSVMSGINDYLQYVNSKMLFLFNNFFEKYF